MEEKNLTYKSPALTNITLQSIMKEEMKKQVDDYLRKTIFKYTALVLQDFMPDKRTSWNEFVDVTSKAYKKEGFKVLKELLSYITYANIQDFSLRAGIEGVDSADPLIRKFSTCLVDELSYIPKNADKVSLANSAFQYVKGTLLPIATSTRVCRYRSLVDPETASGGEYITLSQYGMFDCDKDGVFKAVGYGDEAPKYKHTAIGCFLGENDLETNKEMSVVRNIEDRLFLNTALMIARKDISVDSFNECIIEEFKEDAFLRDRDRSIAEITYEILKDDEKKAVEDVGVKINSLRRVIDALAHNTSFVSFFPEDEELVMSKGVSSEVYVLSTIDIFSETLMKSYDENVGTTLLVAEGHMKIIHSLMESIYKMMSKVFGFDTSRKLTMANDGTLEGYIAPYMSWVIRSSATALITSQPRGCSMCMGKPERNDEPFSVLLISDIRVDPNMP
jgi:hypothetical protein